MTINKNYIKLPKTCNSLLLLRDGKYYCGVALGHENTKIGEICFNTSMSGYQEVITDPSYTGQLVVFSGPHIGNVGTNKEDYESSSVNAEAIILMNDHITESNYRSEENFVDWLKNNKVAAIGGIDTRSLIKYIRKNGAQNALIYTAKDFGEEINLNDLFILFNSCAPMKGREMASFVSCKEAYEWKQHLWNHSGNTNQKFNNFHIVVVDYGVKYNILRSIYSLGPRVTVVPCTSDFETVMSYKPDGIVLSNGPGDPKSTFAYSKTLLEKLIANNIPILAICLGHQLLSLAFGMDTVKMQFGHRGINHPVFDKKSGKVIITSQNHGFVAVTDKNSPSVNNASVEQYSLFDQSIEAIGYRNIISTQYHPEACPGPNDAQNVFLDFMKLVENNQISSN